MRNFHLFKILLSAAFVLLISSCATLSGNGVGRVKHYTVESERLPESFDGLRIAFMSDLHFPSKFTPRRLRCLSRKLKDIGADVVAFGGDYVTDVRSAAELFSSFSSLETVYGKFAVPGNHDLRIFDVLRAEAAKAGVRMLADEAVYLSNGVDSICLVGVYDSFKYQPATEAVIAGVGDEVFTLLLAHTPDFAEDFQAGCDLALSGHTHGGQVSLFGLYTPVKNTKYGARFLRGKNYTTDGVCVITTNGVGTSRRKVRFCVPSEIVVVTLRRK